MAERYETQGLIRSKPTLREILQLAFRQADFRLPMTSQSRPMQKFVWQRASTAKADFIGRAESDILYAIVRSGLEIDFSELAYLLLNDRTQEDTIQSLLDDLKKRSLIVYRNKRYFVAGQGQYPICRRASAAHPGPGYRASAIAR